MNDHLHRQAESSAPRPLLLTGMPGAGKTLTAHWLAQLLSVDVVDLDELFLKEYGRTPAETLLSSGEGQFRPMERELLSKVLDTPNPPSVIACGGGTLADQAFLNRVRPKANVVFLRCSLEELERRLGDTRSRPLLNQGPLPQRLTELWAQREPFYRQADLELEVTGLSPADVAWNVAAGFGLIAPPEVQHQQLQPMLWYRTLQGISMVRVCRRFDVAKAAAWLDSLLPGKHRVLVLDQGIPESMSQDLVSACSADAVIHLEGGESSKSLDRLPSYLLALKNAGAHRGSVAILAGGGSLLDAMGTACAIYMRGIPTVLIPTTLLAAVDASIGGKTAMDVGDAKNLCGVFHPPLGVAVFTQWLTDADAAACKAGAAEMLKAAMLTGDLMLADMAANWAQAGISHAAVHAAILAKLAILDGDVQEKAGQRILLNLGHTFGHALEAALGYSLSHGECVGAGLVVAARMSRALGLCASQTAAQFESLAVKAGFWPLAELPPLEQLMACMVADKKQESNSLVWVLLRDWGLPILHKIPKGDVENLLRHLLEPIVAKDASGVEHEL